VRSRHGRAGFYTLISATYQDQHEQAVLQKRRELHLEKDWLILKGLPTAPALYCGTDVFVRPTITDGDSVSVRECLSLGVPVVASDAVARPPGCVLFKSRDMDGFDAAVESVLGDLPGWRGKMQEIRKQAAGDTAERMVAIYRRVLAEVEGQTGAATAPRQVGH
jgi:glycosyltransferase involved in cell wall biosynthesis